MDEWARFFRISGMFHCSSGPGAWVFGQGGNAAQAGVAYDEQHNVLKAMVNWVEKGVAPNSIEGTKLVNDTVALDVDFMRRHCKFPAGNTYVYGAGSAWKVVACRLQSPIVDPQLPPFTQRWC
jgi:feruloyl esterase